MHRRKHAAALAACAAALAFAPTGTPSVLPAPTGTSSVPAASTGAPTVPATLTAPSHASDDAVARYTGDGATTVVTSHVTRAGVRTAGVRTAAATRAYTLTYASVNGRRTVIRWNPCQTVTVRINPARAPRTGVRDVRAALGVLSQASGIRFGYAGTTTWVPRRSNTYTSTTTQPAEIVIAWAAPGSGRGRSDILPGGNVLGVGGMRYSWSPQRRAQVDSGYIVIDSTKTGWYRPGFGRGLYAGGLYLHELGHALALGHIGVRGQAMYPALTGDQPARLGAGDTAGYAAIGRTAGCIR